LSTHRSYRAQTEKEELGIIRIQNASYSPDFDAILEAINIVNNGVKRKKLINILIGEQQDLSLIIELST
jgi:hypothetical protein